MVDVDLCLLWPLHLKSHPFSTHMPVDMHLCRLLSRSTDPVDNAFEGDSGAGGGGILHFSGKKSSRRECTAVIEVCSSNSENCVDARCQSTASKHTYAKKDANIYTYMNKTLFF